MHSPHLRSQELRFPFLGWSICILYLEFFCMGDFPLILYLLSFIYISMDIAIYLYQYRFVLSFGL